MTMQVMEDYEAAPANRLHAGNADRLLPTLLDRLTDQAPQREHDTASEIAFTRKQLRKIVLRDLSWLLNATNAELDLQGAGLPHIQQSTLNFGLPAFSGKRVSNVKLADLENAIREAILLFEPRITPNTLGVQTRAAVDTETAHNVVSFEIRGQIWAQPYPVELLVRSSIDLETGFVSLMDQLESAAGSPTA